MADKRGIICYPDMDDDQRYNSRCGADFCFGVSMTAVFRAFIFLLLLLTAPALADVTITNFNGAGTGIANRISHHDTNGNDIDAHSGNMLQVGTCPGASCHLYVYGEAHRCGFYWQTIQSPFCGFRVYDYADINNPVDLGYIFDASTSFWQDRCQGATSGSSSGCFQPYMVYNAANNNYVLWFNQFGNPSFQATQNEFVMVCAQPFSTPATIATNCVKQPDPSHFAHGTPPNGSLFPYVDPNTGIAYGIYPNVGTREIYIEQLTADYTDSTGTGIDLGVTGEGTGLFSKGSDWYATYGGLCSYCSAGADTTALHATSPLGTYGSSVVLNVDSCGGQNNRGVAVITGGATTTYLYSSDQWTGSPINQGWADIYWQPLSFTGSAINPFSCNDTVTIPGFTSAGPYPTPALPTPTPDQTTVQDGVFEDRCDVSGTTWRLQTFVPSVASLYAIATPLGQNTAFSASPVAPGTNGNLEVDIVDIAAGVPTTILGSQTISPSTLLWATQWLTVVFNLTLTPGHTYGILLKGVGTTQGCFSNVTSQNSNVYPAGVERVSSNSGGSWTTDSGFAFMFSTFPSLPPPPTLLRLRIRL